MVRAVASQQEGCGRWTETFSVWFSGCLSVWVQYYTDLPFFWGDGGGGRAAGCKLRSIYLDLIALKK